MVVAERTKIKAVLRSCNIIVDSQMAYIIDDKGLSSFDDFLTIQPGPKDWKKIADRCSKKSNDPFPLGAVKICKLVALRLWISNQLSSGKTADRIPYLTFNNIAIKAYLAIIDASENKNRDSELPPTFDPNDWEAFDNATIEYLRAKYGAGQVPLSYVLCHEANRPTDAELVLASPYDRRFWMTQHTGDTYDIDSRRVWGYLSGRINATEGWRLINNKYVKDQGAQAAYPDLRTLYDGTSEINKRVSQARAELDNIRYSSEQSFPFIKYVAKLLGLFDALERGKQGRSEQEKVFFLINYISTSNVRFTAAVQAVSTSHCNDFRQACNVLSIAVSDIFPTVGWASQKRRAIVLEMSTGHGDALDFGNPVDGVQFDKTNWDAGFQKSDYDKFPRMLRRLIGLAKDINSFQAIAPLTAQEKKRGTFLKGHISLKNWTYCPLFRHDTSSFKRTCFLTRKKKRRFLCMGHTSTAVKPFPTNNGPKQLSVSWESNPARGRSAKCYLRR
jgi:hypothetical protein